MKKIVLQDRDNKIIEFLRDFKCATTSTISDLFFNGSIRPTQRRMKFLTEHGYIRAYQENVITEKIYYIKRKPIQLKHSLILSSLIAELKKHDVEILKYKVSYKLDHVIADCFLAIRYNNKNYIYFIEIENTKKFDLKKYEDLYFSRSWKNVFPLFPNILVVSNRVVNKNNKLSITNIKLDFSNINDLIKDLG